MKHLLIAASALSLLAGSVGVAAAQPGRDDHRMDNHGPMDRGPMTNNGWHRGGRIASNDWRRGQVIDYRSHHLRAPPRGYQWRQVDGNYVLAAVAGGLIADIIANN